MKPSASSMGYLLVQTCVAFQSLPLENKANFNHDRIHSLFEPLEIALQGVRIVDTFRGEFYLSYGFAIEANQSPSMHT